MIVSSDVDLAEVARNDISHSRTESFSVTSGVVPQDKIATATG